MLTVGLAVVPPETMPGPAQLNVFPAEISAEITTDVVVHVSVPPVTPASGGVLLRPTSAVAVLVQPFAVLVTVTVNVPEAVTVGFAVLPFALMPDPLQLNPVPNVDAAERSTEVVVQVSVPPVALAPGGVMSEFTDAVALLVQPPKDVVTVTV